MGHVAPSPISLSNAPLTSRMNTSPIISALRPQFQEALKTIGITDDMQLARIGPAGVWRDLVKSWEFFPEKHVSIPPTLIEEICDLALQQARELGIPLHQQATSEATTSEFARKPGTPPFADEPQNNVKVRATPPAFQPAHNGQHYMPPVIQQRTEEEELEGIAGNVNIQKLAEEEKAHNLTSKNYAIRCLRPYSIYLGSWAALLAIVSFAVFISIPLIALVFTFPFPFYHVMGAVFAFVIPYVILLPKATSSVFRLLVLLFRNYPHNRAAHKCPFLGYTISTALHIITLFWYRCPACGTPQKLFTAKRR